jgi:hypothetical protein
MKGTTSGLIVLYGNQRLVEANADWRGYSLDPYKDRCGFATMSPANLGHIGWFWVEQTESWFGPCLAVDVSALKDFYANVYVRKEIAEVGKNIATVLDFRYGEQGWVFLGVCPPGRDPTSVVAPYEPLLRMHPLGQDARAPSMYPYQEQQWPEDCSEPTVRREMRAK